MKFSVLLSTISKQLSEIASIAGSSTNKDDITQNILIKVADSILVLKATNYNIELQTEIPLTDVESEGEITVNANKLKETLSNLDQNNLVNFNYDEQNNLLVLSNGSTNFEIRTRSIIDSCLLCVSNEDFRDYLRGVRFEVNGSKLEIFTSDGHRMAILETQLDNPSTDAEPFGVILTKRCASQLAKIVNEEADSDVILSFTKNAVQTSCNNYKMNSKLINCGYPNVRTVIPKTIDSIISIPKDTFTNLIKQVSVLSSKRVNGVTFTFGGGQVTLRSENSEHEVATASLALPDAQSNIEISLNAQYVREVLGVIKTDNVLFCFSQPMIHVLIKPETEVNDLGVKASYIISKVVV